MGELTVLAATLQRLHASGQLVVSDAADATGLDKSTIYKWISGEKDPGFTNFMLLFRHCGSQDVQASLLNVITGGTGWVSTHIDTDLDINGDGDVDLDDAQDANIRSLQLTTENLAQLRQGGRDPGHVLSDSQRAALDALCQEVIVAMASQMQIHAHVNERSRRRKARPVVVGAQRRSL